MAKKLILLLFLASCTLGETGMRPSTGAVNELLIVTNDKTQWEGALGDTLRAFFAAEQIGLSQPEPVFDITNVADENFGDLFQKYHNIFIADINPGVAASVSETSKNTWSEPQRVIKITAPDLPSFYKEFDLKKSEFIRLFIELERQRTLTINQLDIDYKLSNTVENKFGIRMTFPEGFYVAKEAPDFMWLRYTLAKAKQDVELGVLIYTTDYHDTIVFDPRHIIKWRNMITMEHIPGSVPLSFMKVASEVIPPVFNTINDFPGGYAVETRGLWEVQNDFMGGPFISYTFIDRVKNKVITLDGYVYNPNDDKKNFLRQLEAVFFSLKFSAPQ
jgi:hypothetical protein